MLFVKIYQYNYFIAVSYQRQRLEQTKYKLEKELGACNVQLARLQSSQTVQEWANSKKMNSLTLSSIVTVTTKIL